MSYSTQGDNSLISFVQQIGLFLKGDILEEFHLCRQWSIFEDLLHRTHGANEVFLEPSKIGHLILTGWIAP